MIGDPLTRRDFLELVRGAAIALAGVPLGAVAQQARTLPRIGLLVPAATPNEAPFRQGLRQLGYEDGRTIVIERRSAEGDFTRLPGLAAELVALRPDVIAAFVTQASIAARQATSKIPIVMIAVADPVASGLVDNLARPGGNVTGTAGQNSAVVGKQLELIRELRPGADRVATLWNPANAVFQEQSVREARAAAQRLGMKMRLVEARNPAELERAFATIAADRPDAVQVLGDPLFVANIARIAELLRQHRLLAVGGSRVYAEAGILAVYAPDLAESSRRAATYVDKILRGVKPGDLPVELADKFELIVNLGTAKALGVAIAPALLARADEVIR